MPRGYRAVGTSDDADDINALIASAERLPKSSSGDGEYVALQDMDDLGRPVDSESNVRRPLNGKVLKARRPKALFAIWLGVVILVIAFAGLRQQYVSRHDDDSYLRAHGTVSNGTTLFHATTLLISLDGFHPSYSTKEGTPNINRFAKGGASVPYMTPSFPSQTFPNHWTLVTGLYPQNHGIVGNSFYDPRLDKQFKHTDPSKSLDRDFWGGEALWTTARKHQRISAVHMWPGSEVDWENDGPNYVDPFQKTEPLDNKRQRIFQWLDMPIETRPELILAYVPNIDTVGHAHGIEGPELDTELKLVDDFIGSVLTGLQDRNLTDIVNVVIVSDHGMAPTSDERLLFLDDYLDLDLVARRSGWPLAGLRFKDPAIVEDIRANLTAHIPNEAAKVFASNNMPADWHFSSTKSVYGYRLPPLYVVPNVGYSILTHDEYDKMGNKYNLAGVHGYNNTEVLMRAFFAAQGPFFSAATYEPFPNVNIYGLVCRSLGLTPAKNDGTTTNKVGSASL